MPVHLWRYRASDEDTGETQLLRCISTGRCRCSQVGKEAPPCTVFRVPFQRTPRETRNGTLASPRFVGLCPQPRGLQGMTPLSDEVCQQAVTRVHKMALDI